jgi:hypothetical protein
MTNMMMTALAASLLATCAPAATDVAGGGAGGGTSAGRTLANGTQISVTTTRMITSRSDEAGQTLMTTVDADVKNASGRVVILAGSALALTITEISPARTKSAADGSLTLAVTSVTVRGTTYPLAAKVTSVDHTLKGRGVTLGEVEKVAAGAAIGAVAGRVIGGDSKGTTSGRPSARWRGHRRERDGEPRRGRGRRIPD